MSIDYRTLARAARWLLISAWVAALALGSAGVGANDREREEAQGLSERDIDELLDEVRAISPVMAERRVEDLRGHIERIENTPHAVESDPRSPAGKAGPDGTFCFECHGDGFEHFFRIGSDIRTEEANAVCLHCHAGGDRMHWHGGMHEFQDMACIDCHTLHGENERLLHTPTQIELCSACHQERRVDFHRPYHHPVREGQMTCSDCHNPHGTTGPSLLREGDVNQTCYQCHAEYRGPFLWDHQPVREDCTHCHNPHGTVHPGMLETRTTQLCQSCHLTIGHPGDLLGPEHDSPQQGKFMVRGNRCLNCHTQVHGSNHPGGAFFRR